MVGDQLPPVVVVPAHPAPVGPGYAPTVHVELTRLADDGVAMVAYSNVARLVELLGGQQPWVMLPAGALCSIMQARSVHAPSMTSSGSKTLSPQQSPARENNRCRRR